MVAGEGDQTSPATNETGETLRLVSATSTESSLCTGIEINGEIGGQPCKWLLDTGAQISVIVESLAIGAKGSRVKPLHVPHTVDGTSMETLYDLITCCRIDSHIVRKHRFTVVRQSSYSAIIGMDLLTKLDLKLFLGSSNYYGSMSNPQEGTRKNSSAQAPKVCCVYATSRTLIPPRSLHIIQGKIDKNIRTGSVGIIDSSHEDGIERFNVGCGRVLDKVREGGKVMLHVTNPTDSPQEVPEGSIIGMFFYEHN